MVITITTNVAMPEIPGQVEMVEGSLRDLLLRLFAAMQATRELVNVETGEMNIEEFFEIRLNGGSCHSLPRGLDTALHDGDGVQISLILFGGG